MKKDFGFVILNYHTPDETLQLLNDLSIQPWFNEINVYVVDNASQDDSRSYFEEINIPFFSIYSNSNLGYSKGNNLGIQKAKADGCEYVICLNSDISLEEQPNFLNIIRNLYHSDSNIAVIAPAIKNLDGFQQNPFRQKRFSIPEIIRMKFFYQSGMHLFYYWIRLYLLYNIITQLTILRKERAIDHHVQSHEFPSSKIYAPQGSCVIFTPLFFQYFEGFDPHPFLFCEEYILAEKLWENDLSCWFENTLKVIHLESRATDKTVANYFEKVKFTLQHTFSSCKYFSSKVLKCF